MLKDTEIYDNIEQKELRLFFANILLNNHIRESKLFGDYNANKQAAYRTSFDDFDSVRKALKIAELDAKFYQLRLEILNVTLATLILMKEKGWEQLDISDETIKTGEHYLSFIGTKDEYNSLFRK